MPSNYLAVATYIGDGTTTQFQVPFPYLHKEHIRVFTIAPGSITKIELAPEIQFTWINNGAIRVSTLPIPGTRIRIERHTPRETPMVDFTNGSTLDERDLDLETLQLLYISQETYDFADPERMQELADVTEVYRNEAELCRDQSCECAGEAEAARDEALNTAQTAQETVQGAINGIIEEGDNQVNRLAGEGNTQVGRIITEGAHQAGIVLDAVITAQETVQDALSQIHNTAHQELGQIVQEGNNQVNRVQQEGAAQVSLAHDEVAAAREARDGAELARDQAVSVAEVGPASRTEWGWVRVGDGIEVTADGTISVLGNRVVTEPSASFPEVVGIGYEYTLTMSAESAINGAEISHFLVKVDEEPEMEVEAEDGGQAEVVLTPDGANGATGMIAVVAVDTAGNSSNVTRISYIQQTVVLNAPGVVYPQQNGTGVPLNITMTWQAASLASGPPDAAVGTRLQIARDAEFVHIFYDNGASASYATQDEIEFSQNSEFYARVRHRFALYGWTDWGTVTEFTTLDARPYKPVIYTPTNNAAEVALKPTITLSNFGNNGPADTPNATEIQIASDIDFATVVAEYTGTYLTSWTPDQPLTPLTQYWIRARYTGVEYGQSPWSNVLSFTTHDAWLNAPVITSPASGATGIGVSPAVVTEAPDYVGQTVTKKQVQVSTVANFSTVTWNSGEIAYTTSNSTTVGTSLAVNTQHYVRQRFQGSVTGWTAWATVVGFTTINPKPNTPTISAPSNNATGVALKPTITISAFSNPGPTDTAKTTQIQIATDSAFSAVAASYNSTFVTSWTSGTALAVNTKHYVRARVEGTLYGWSDWSATTAFTTLAASLNAPAITAPASGATDVWLTPEIVTSAPTVTGQTVAKKQVQVSAASGFGTIFWDSGQIAYTSNNSTTVGTTLAKSTQYYVRQRFQGSVTGWTGWSTVVSFTSQAAAVDQVWSYNSSGTFTVPVTGKYTLEVAGGKGGSWSGTATGYRFGYDAETTSTSCGGANGGYAKSVGVSLTKSASLSCTVGAAGGNASFSISGGYDRPESSSGSARAGSGGTSSVASYLSATGGQGGAASYSKNDFGDSFYGWIYIWGSCSASSGAGTGGNTTNSTGVNAAAGYVKITYTGPS
jgi:hypothetical protein